MTYLNFLAIITQYGYLIIKLDSWPVNMVFEFVISIQAT